MDSYVSFEYVIINALLCYSAERKKNCFYQTAQYEELHKQILLCEFSEFKNWRLKRNGILRDKWVHDVFDECLL